MCKRMSVVKCYKVTIFIIYKHMMIMMLINMVAMMMMLMMIMKFMMMVMLLLMDDDKDFVDVMLKIINITNFTFIKYSTIDIFIKSRDIFCFHSSYFYPFIMTISFHMQW